MPKVNLKKVLDVFTKKYKPIPLEYFRKNPYKILISTLLSARTRDETTLKVAKELFIKAPNIRKLNLFDTDTLAKFIYPVGFYKTKAKHLKKLSDVIISKYRGEIPNTFNELIQLPGVGRKTANLVLNRAFDKPAIAVDTHVHKISNMLGWVKTNTPEQTEKELVKIIPKKYWSKMNRLFVSIGRQYYSKRKLEDFLKKEVL